MPKVDLGAGAAAEAAIAGFPLGPFAVDVAIERKVLPNGSYWGRVGHTCGEFVRGVVQMGLAAPGSAASGWTHVAGTGGTIYVKVPAGMHKVTVTLP